MPVEWSVMGKPIKIALIAIVGLDLGILFAVAD
jgi:hypothetical protein